MKKYIFAIVIFIIILGGLFLVKREQAPAISEVEMDTKSAVEVSATLNPKKPKAGEQVTITLSLTDTQGNPIKDLAVYHKRRLHAVIVSEDFSTFGHIHPEDFSPLSDEAIRQGRYTLAYTFPKAGRYLLAVDMRKGEDTIQKLFLTSVQGKPKMGALQKDLQLSKCFKGYAEQGSEDRYVDPVFTLNAQVSCDQGYKITLLPSKEILRAGEPIKFTYHVEKNREAVANLTPFLGAPLHIAIVPESLTSLLHIHGSALSKEEHHEAKHEEKHEEKMMDTVGPDLVSEQIEFPAKGVYHLFGQAKHEGRIIFSHFIVEVSEAFNRTSAKPFDLAIANRTLSPSLVNVTQGDGVILRVRTDEQGEFHLAGYELEKEMDVTRVTELLFTADKPGRYNLELHPANDKDKDIVIGAFVVNPK